MCRSVPVYHISSSESSSGDWFSIVLPISWSFNIFLGRLLKQQIKGCVYLPRVAHKQRSTIWRWILEANIWLLHRTNLSQGSLNIFINFCSVWPGPASTEPESECQIGLDVQRTLRKHVENGIKRYIYLSAKNLEIHTSERHLQKVKGNVYYGEKKCGFSTFYPFFLPPQTYHLLHVLWTLGNLTPPLLVGRTPGPKLWPLHFFRPRMLFLKVRTNTVVDSTVCGMITWCHHGRQSLSETAQRDNQQIFLFACFWRFI